MDRVTDRPVGTGGGMTHQKQSGDSSFGYQILLKSPPHERGKKIDLSVKCKSPRVSQKWSFWYWYWGLFDTPRHPQNSVGMVYVGTNFCPQVPPMRQIKKDPSVKCKSQSVEY